MAFGTSLYWRETHKQPKLVIFDGRLIVLLLLVILHVRLWTIFLVLLAMLVLFFFERKGVPADSILRYLRSSLVGKKRTARGISAERMPVDFGYESRYMVEREAERISAMSLKMEKSKKIPKKKTLKAGVSR